jgi:hypothetical protein
VAVQTVDDPSVTVTVAPGSPVPVNVGVESLVTDPEVGAVTTGAIGAVVSMVTPMVVAGDSFPEGSVWVTVNV